MYRLHTRQPTHIASLLPKTLLASTSDILHFLSIHNPTGRNFAATYRNTMLDHSERTLATETIPSRVFLPRLNTMLVFFKDPTLDEEFESLLADHADKPITTELLLPLLKQDVYFR